jgi:caffeoyl-CoA O-methyltransferase
VFIDGDKREYSEYYDLVFDKVLRGGFIIADNVLWGGKIEDGQASGDPQTKGVITFNEKVRSDQRVEKVMLPVRDGILIARKK